MMVCYVIYSYKLWPEVVGTVGKDRENWAVWRQLVTSTSHRSGKRCDGRIAVWLVFAECVCPVRS